MKTSTKRSWEITPSKVELAIKKIIEVGNPKKIILFGSYVKNMTNINSDVDFIVVSRNDIENPRKESIRIRRALRGISMPMDIIVVPEQIWNRFKDQPGMIYREALRQGRIVYDS